MNTASALGTEGRARWALKLFGGFELSLLPGGEKVAGLGKRERVLLAYLALNPKGKEQRRKLTTLLWGDNADETTLDNLRNCLYSLRKALGDSEHRVVTSDGEEIVLDASVFEVDVLAFRRLAAPSGRAGLEEAAKLYTGGLLDGLDIESEEFESWCRTEAQRCRDQAVDALNRLMAQLAESGETDRAIETGQRLLTLDPLHESSVRRLMRLYAQTGRRSTAIQLYRTLGDALKADLDAPPEAETRAVFEDISRGGEERVSASPATASTPPPVSGRMVHQSDATAGPLPPPGTQSNPAANAPRMPIASRRNWILAGGLAAAMALVLAYQLVPWTDTTAQQTTKVEAADAASSPTGTISIAVLPFANLSSDPEQEFFSDGMTDEIASALGRIRDLRVVGRSSAFQFKGQNRDLRAVGQSLGATHLIEGSVRRVGTRLRITSQLIQADNGLQVWTETYDRELTDIFATQEDIAQAIAAALRVPLGLQPGGRLVSSRIGDVETYQDYLRARAFYRGVRMDQARSLLGQVLARDPGYARAWALQVVLLDAELFFAPATRSGSVGDTRRLASELVPKMEMAAQRAIQLDPNLPDGYVSLALLQFRRGKPLLAEELFLKALALDPDHPDALDFYAQLLLSAGRLKEALATTQKVRLLEPFVPTFTADDGPFFWLNGQKDAAIELLNEQAIGNPNRSVNLARFYATEGRYDQAADALLEMSPGGYLPGTVEEAARLLRLAPATAAPPQDLPSLGNLGFVYLHVGAADRYLEFLEQSVQGGYGGAAGSAVLWHPAYAPVRKMERFKAYVRAAGLVDYWRAKGWPEFCRPVGADDFSCN